MILILTDTNYEQGTDPVISWLLHYGVPFMRLTADDLVDPERHVAIDVTNDDIRIDGISLRDDISVVWYRRFNLSRPIVAASDDEPYQAQLQKEWQHEFLHLTEYFFQVLEKKTCLPKPSKAKVNKLLVQKLAEECGFRTPDTRILTRKKDVLDFQQAYPAGLITKPINFCGYYNENGYSYTIFTNLVTEELLEQTPDVFAPTLFQERADAAYEIRCFYLDGKTFATATLNADPNRDVDKKLTARDQKTHQVRYEIPAALQKKIDHLMRRMGLLTGTLDIIRDQQGEYIFIEVNPVGQYGAESHYCQFQLDQRMAEWLVRQHHHHLQTVAA